MLRGSNRAEKWIPAKQLYLPDERPCRKWAQTAWGPTEVLKSISDFWKNAQYWNAVGGRGLRCIYLAFHWNISSLLHSHVSGQYRSMRLCAQASAGKLAVKLRQPIRTDTGSFRTADPAVSVCLQMSTSALTQPILLEISRQFHHPALYRISFQYVFTSLCMCVCMCVWLF